MQAGARIKSAISEHLCLRLDGLDVVFRHLDFASYALQVAVKVVGWTSGIHVLQASSVISCTYQLDVLRVVSSHLVKDHIAVDCSKAKIT